MRNKQLAEWLEGQISSSNQRELTEVIRNEPEFRREAAKETVVKRLLEARRTPEDEFVEQVLARVQRSKERPQSSRRRLRIKWTIVRVAAVAVILLGLYLIIPDFKREAGIRVVAAEGVDTLDSKALNNRQRLNLRSGLLELDLHGEARVVIEAPAVFRIVSPHHIQLMSGRCFAEMLERDANLRIETPAGDIVDLGTMFAVDVTSPDSMDVHVFDGAVEVINSKGTKRLTEGQGLSIKGTKELKELVASPGLFVSMIPPRNEPVTPGLHWSFDEGVGSRVATTAVKDDSATAGTLISEDPGSPGPRWIEGVFGHALQFNGKGDWVKTRHAGVSGTQDRTVACWVRLPPDWGGTDRAALMAWGHKSKKKVGSAWMLTIRGDQSAHPERWGRLRLSVGGQSALGTTDLRDGQWHHVAAVSQSGATGMNILLYVDGQLEIVTRSDVERLNTDTEGEHSETLRFGRQIYWEDHFLRGALDEIYLFEVALSGDQIRSLMMGEGI